MKCPDTDVGFADSPIHGADVQRRLLQSVLPFCKTRRRALDIGAHIGLWTTQLALRFKHVDAFEPERVNFGCLKANALEFDNVTLHETAVGADHGRCRVVNLGANSGCGFVTRGGDSPIVPIDSFDFQDVDFIKLDIEGYEGRALTGAVDTLKKSKPVVFFEDNGLGAVHFGPAWTDPKTVLQELGYRHRARISKNELWTA